MIESMTGFGEGKAEGQHFLVTVSARSVNHRYLDLAIRMPEFLRRHEPQLAELARAKIARGRVEIRVDTTLIGEDSRRVELRQGVLRSYQEAILAAQAEGLLVGDVSAGDMLRLPEVVEIASANLEATEEEDLDTLREATKIALDHLQEVRRAEGSRLGGSLREILQALGSEIDALDSIREQLKDELAVRVEDRLEKLMGEVEVDSDRVAMEIAILAERSDVQEEIDRLAAHLEAFGELLRSEDAAGKKLDFLCQEILRELNTVGSKCRDSKAMPHVLEGKVVCEQLREQVQNIQ